LNREKHIFIQEIDIHLRSKLKLFVRVLVKRSPNLNIKKTENFEYSLTLFEKERRNIGLSFFIICFFFFLRTKYLFLYYKDPVKQT